VSPLRADGPPLFDVVCPLIEAWASNTAIAPAFDRRALLRFMTRHHPIAHVWPWRRTPWRLRPRLTLGLDLRLEQGSRLGLGLSLGLTMRLSLGLA
jgi:hypothetical protein